MFDIARDDGDDRVKDRFYQYYYRGMKIEYKVQGRIVRVRVTRLADYM